MASTGNNFRDALIDEIKNVWGIPGIEVYKEVWVGNRFVGTKRKLDIVLRAVANNKTFGIEAKTQNSTGTADEKLFYALDDCKNSPIPTIIAFSGAFIGADIKSKLILSGYGVEVDINYDPVTKIITVNNSEVLRQRAMIELDLDWLYDQRQRLV